MKGVRLSTDKRPTIAHKRLIGRKEPAEITATLYEQLAEADRLEATIKRNLEVLGYGE